MSRQQSVLRNTVGYILKIIDNKAINGEEKSKPEVIKLGFVRRKVICESVSAICE